jgi:hypothetical protein
MKKRKKLDKKEKDKTNMFYVNASSVAAVCGLNPHQDADEAFYNAVATSRRWRMFVDQCKRELQVTTEREAFGDLVAATPALAAVLDAGVIAATVASSTEALNVVLGETARCAQLTVDQAATRAEWVACLDGLAFRDSAPRAMQALEALHDKVAVLDSTTRCIVCMVTFLLSEATTATHEMAHERVQTITRALAQCVRERVVTFRTPALRSDCALSVTVAKFVGALVQALLLMQLNNDTAAGFAETLQSLVSQLVLSRQTELKTQLAASRASAKPEQQHKEEEAIKQPVPVPLAETLALQVQDLVGNVVRDIVMRRGVALEAPTLDASQQCTGSVVSERNTTLRLLRTPWYTIGGRVDGYDKALRRVIEVKVRRRFWSAPPPYDLVQLRVYMHMLQSETIGETEAVSGMLLERFPDNTTRETILLLDETDAFEWDRIHQALMRVSESFARLDDHSVRALVVRWAQTCSSTDLGQKRTRAF